MCENLPSKSLLYKPVKHPIYTVSLTCAGKRVADHDATSLDRKAFPMAEDERRQRSRFVRSGVDARLAAFSISEGTVQFGPVKNPGIPYV